MNYAEFIKKLRKKCGLSQEYLAEQLDISRPTYIQIEKGERDLTLAEAEKLALIFGMTLDEFRTRDQKKRDIKVVLEKSKRKISKIVEERISVPQQKIEKFKEVLLYVLKNVIGKPNVGETVIYKLFYFIDFDYYEKFEEQLIGAKYIKNHHGPTPVEFKKIVEEMESNHEVERVKSKYYQYEQRKYLPHREPDLSKLSAREIKHIDYVLEKLSDKNANELSDLSHNDVPWITAENGDILDYEAVFYRTPETSTRNYDNEDSI